VEPPVPVDGPATAPDVPDGQPPWWTEPTVGRAYDTGSDAWLREQPPAAPAPPADQPPALPGPSSAAAALAEALAALQQPAAPPVPAAAPPVATPAPAEAPAAPAAPAGPHVPPVPRGSHAAGRTAPGRAVAGALVAVAGVLLGIGALLWITDSPQTATSADQGVAASSSSSPAPVAPVASQVPAAAVPVTPAPVVPSPSPAVSPPVAAPAVPRLPLTVLNNSRRTGLADRAASRFAGGGWPVTLTGNFTGQIPETTVYYAPGQQASALLLQRTFPGLTRVRPRFDGLPGSGLTVVLTRAYDTSS
jgi:hypothetical protein